MAERCYILRIYIEYVSQPSNTSRFQGGSCATRSWRCWPVSRDMAARLMRGQSIILRGREAPVSGKVYATCNGLLVAVGDVERGELVPHRVFNLGA